MDYVVDQIPGINYLSEDTRKIITDHALTVLRWADWACGTRDLRDMYKQHTSYILGEFMFLFVALLTFIHAWRKGTRYLLLWCGIVMHGLNTELVSYWIPDIDNFWHAQSILMFFGRRLPIYVLFGIYPFFDYVGNICAKRMHLPWWAEGPMCGLVTVLLDIPYDILGIKMLWWTWHDTDPNVYDRMYWVPWTSYYFHAAFACSFNILLKFWRSILVNKEYDWKLLPREMLAVFLSSSMSFFVGAAQFIPLYHLFHDYCKVPSECVVILFLSFYALLVWKADRRHVKQARVGFRWFFDELALAVGIHYLFFMGLAVIGQPENTVSIGLHEPIGPCDIKAYVQTSTGLKLEKRAFLCATNYDEDYFDWHCLPGANAPKSQMKGEALEWYEICGTPFPNHIEYIFVVWSLSFVGMFIIYQALARSGDTPVDPVKVYLRKKKRE